MLLPAKTVTVRFVPGPHSIEVPVGTSLLQAAREAGLPVASSCGENAVCARCGMQVLKGGANIAPETAREAAVKARNRIDPKTRLSCLVMVESDLEVTAAYW